MFAARTSISFSTWASPASDTVSGSPVSAICVQNKIKTTSEPVIAVTVSVEHAIGLNLLLRL